MGVGHTHRHCTAQRSRAAADPLPPTPLPPRSPPLSPPSLKVVLMMFNGVAILNNDRFLEKCACFLALPLSKTNTNTTNAKQKTKTQTALASRRCRRPTG